MRVRESANLRARSETEFAALQLTAGSGAITSDRSRATISTKFATTLASTPSGKKLGYTLAICPLRTARTSRLRASLSEAR